MKLKLFVRNLMKWVLRCVVLPVVYRLCCIYYRKVNNNMIVFADAHHTEFPADMRLVRQEAVNRKFEIVDIVHDFSKINFVKSVKVMLRFMKYYAQAGYVVLCDYYLPVISVKKRRQTKVVQIWHACGAYKQFGYDATDDLGLEKNKNMFCNYDYVVVSSPQCIPFYASAFHVDEKKVLPLGVSRTDQYFSDTFASDCKKHFYELYPEARNKKIVLWAPTFRNNAAVANASNIEDINGLEKKLGEEWFFVKKLHPHLEKVSHASNCDIPTEQLYAVADVLITDYSSVIFDYALTKKPILIYASDRKQYESDRGFYLDFNTIPAKFVDSKEKLFDILDTSDYYVDEHMYDTFVEQQLQMCDGYATKRIFDEIIVKNINEG